MASGNGQVGGGTLQLSKTEESTLQNLETVIGKGIEAWMEVGIALRKIKDGRLYRAGYESFEAYCHGRWGRTRQWAYQTIEAAETVDPMAGNPNKMSSALDKSLGSDGPTSVRQARALKDVPPEKRPEVWREARESAPKGKVTAAHVRRVARQEQPDPPADPSTDTPAPAPPPSASDADPEAMDESEPDASGEPFAEWNAGVREIIASMNHTVSLMRRVYGAKGSARQGVEFANPYAARLVNVLTTIRDQEQLRRYQEEIIVVRQTPDGSIVTVGDIKSRRASA